MRGAIPLFPQYVFVVWCLVKHRENFTLYVNDIYRNVMNMPIQRRIMKPLEMSQSLNI
jgi:hypothetical protein